ncbi:response regulator [Cohnella sp. GCM10027633]|uniref:response regulator transcription factor n=1 Tax=unclassified Cohnella TaxID=2636738 RepID=UPI00362C23F8
MYKVIIVDDEMIVRHAVHSLIKWEGGRFEHAGSASSGVSALELAGRTSPDIVITDIKMAEMDGLELIKQLTASGFDGEILVLSNYNDFELVREALKCGAHDYMLKLTLKSDSFMQALEEMATKLDGRRTRGIQAASSARDPRTDKAEKLREWLARTDAGEGQSESRAAPEQDMRLRWYSFIFCRLESDARGIQEADAGDKLEKVADELLPGREVLAIVRTNANRYVMAAAVPVSSAALVPEELAQRMIRLAEMYYGYAFSVVYGREAQSFHALADQLHASRKAEELRFYARFKEGALPNALAARDEGEEFLEAEARFKSSLRGSGSLAIELWTESALLLAEIAAKQLVHPRTLKRAVVGGIWNVANAAAFGTDNPWNEKAWVEKIEAADSDTQLMILIRELSDEIYETLGRATKHGAVREEIRQALAYLDKRYAERIFISDVAAHVGLSEPYLCHVFKTETGMSILTRLNEIRMVKAHELLATGNYLIKQAAAEVGIPDPFYFNRLFKKRFGISPKNVKKAPRAEDV